MDIRGNTALVTGAASGLGLATVKMLADAGAVVCGLDRDTEKLEEMKRQLPASFIRCVDLTDAKATAIGIASLIDEVGPLRIVVNCAGIGLPGRLVDRSGKVFDLAAFRRIIDVNLMGSVHVLHAVLPDLVAAEPLNADGERGVIINTSSVAAFDGQAGQVSYSAAKGAIAAMTLPAARDLARFGIRVMAIAPGLFRTPILAGLRDDVLAGLEADVPFPKRAGAPSEYAKLVSSIIKNSMLNGDTFRIDGALRLR